ncbi:hypothetical protein [Haloterrigena salifodinae]|uniref:hypothetical protein n=1 Tax=Haloterrigena salifodinae TaxID=2675099 RepID=UPI000F8911CC|nr:hypothetical protein [Haloterrigena salifodinae]
MTSNPRITEALKFDSDPSTQEFIDGFLQALEDQYSYDRLKDLSMEHLEDELEYFQNDLDIFKWRLINNNRVAWKSEMERIEDFTDITRTYGIDRPTVDELHQISWTINRIERNFDRAWRHSTDGKLKKLVSNIKYFFIGSPQFGGVGIDFSRKLTDDGSN